MNMKDPYHSRKQDEETQPMPLNPDEDTQSMPVNLPPVHRPVEWVDPTEPLQPIPIQRKTPPSTQSPIEATRATVQMPPSGGPYRPTSAGPSQSTTASRPIQPPSAKSPTPRRQAPPRRSCCASCLIVLLIPLIVLGMYFFLPLRTNLLLLGIDRTPEGTDQGRSDTMILVSVIPLMPTVEMLSIPRDLWVDIPGQGENRINTAHYFGEIEQSGSGPQAATQVIQEDFGVPVTYYARVRFDGFMEIIEAMGGVDVTLTTTMAGLEPGAYHLDADEALAFARDRKGTDDFFRMENTQFLILSAARQLIKPTSWSHIPAVASAFMDVVDTNIPSWQWPRLGLALLRAGPDGVDHRTVEREMVTPFTTDGGAEVLQPNWDAINPVVKDMFGISK